MSQPALSPSPNGIPPRASASTPPISYACVIPCYNCEDTLEHAVFSVLAQTHPLEEIILVDDHSTDTTWAVIGTLEARDSRIKGIRLAQNAGPSKARNTGWAAAQAEFIAFLDADDAWHPEKLAFQAEVLSRFPNTDLVGHLVDVAKRQNAYQDLSQERTALDTYLQPITKWPMLRSNPWSTPTVVMRRSLPFQFDEDQSASEDYLLWAQIILAGYKGIRINLPLAHLFKARYGASGLSGNYLHMQRGQMITIQKLNQRGYISFPLMCGLLAFSIVKFLRRLAVKK